VKLMILQLPILLGGLANFNGGRLVLFLRAKRT
jgi:hypothetical protein